MFPVDETRGEAWATRAGTNVKHRFTARDNLKTIPFLSAVLCVKKVFHAEKRRVEDTEYRRERVAEIEYLLLTF